MDWGLWLAVAGSAISAAGVLSGIVIFRTQQKQAAKLQRTEIYQRLELASVEVFQFEADNAETLERFRDKIARRKKFAAAWPAIERFKDMEDIEDAEDAGRRDPSGALREIYDQYVEIEDDVRIVRKYYEQTLNLFEMAARFRRSGIMEEPVFGSWVIWYYDTVREWAFRWIWSTLELETNYTSELRETFNYAVHYFNWIDEDEEALKADFFKHVARINRCDVIRDWLSEVHSAKDALKHQIDRVGVPKYKPWPGNYGAAPVPRSRKGEVAPGPLATADDRRSS